MSKTVRRTASTFVAAALLVLTGHAATVAATAAAAGAHGARQAAISMQTPGVPCVVCGG